MSNEIVLDLPDNDLSLAPLRDAYLDAWRRYGARAELMPAFRLAQRLSSITGALGWYHEVSRLPPPLQKEYAVPVPVLLKEFLDADLD